MSTTQSPGAEIETVVAGWPGVSVGPHRFGGREYRVGTREFGHTHGDAQADIPFPVALRDVLVAEGRTSEHHLYPDSGWVTFYLGPDGGERDARASSERRSDGDTADAVALLRLSYLWHVAGLQKRADESVADVDVAAELAELRFGDGVERAFARILG